MSSPFIHLLKTPQNKYFYDVQRNAIIRVSTELYKQLASGDVADTLEVQELRKYGFLSEKHVARIEHSCTWIEELLIDASLKFTLKVLILAPYGRETSSFLTNKDARAIDFAISKINIDGGVGGIYAFSQGVHYLVREIFGLAVEAKYLARIQANV